MDRSEVIAFNFTKLIVLGLPQSPMLSSTFPGLNGATLYRPTFPQNAAILQQQTTSQNGNQIWNILLRKSQNFYFLLQLFNFVLKLPFSSWILLKAELFSVFGVNIFGVSILPGKNRLTCIPNSNNEHSLLQKCLLHCYETQTYSVKLITLIFL